MPKSAPPKYLTIAETMQALGYKTRKSVLDLVAGGYLTPIKPPVTRGRNAPRVFFDSSQVAALTRNPARLSRTQAAACLGVNVRTLDRLVERKQLTAHPVKNKLARRKRRVEFDANEIDALKQKMIVARA